MQDDEVFYTDKQLRARWHCSHMKLYRLRQRGALKSILARVGVKASRQETLPPKRSKISGLLLAVGQDELRFPPRLESCPWQGAKSQPLRALSST